jgi:hypothetical protein
MSLTTLERLFAEHGALKAELLRRCMIYQYEAKQTVAKHFSLTFEKVDLPYLEWVKLRERYTQETGFTL